MRFLADGHIHPTPRSPGATGVLGLPSLLFIGKTWTKTALTMIFKLAQAAEKSWHRLRGHDQLPKVILGVKFNDGIEVVRSQAQAAAA